MSDLPPLGEVVAARPRGGACCKGALAALVAGTALGACARPEAPPGGPEDRFPPYVVATVPDTFAVVEEGVRKFEFKFSERISERTASGTVAEAVVVSPPLGNVRVKHARDGLSVETQRGLAPGRVYRVTVLPVVNDMFGNSLRDAFDLVVSTGGEFVPNVVAGVVEDRVTGAAVSGVRVEAAFAQDGDTVAHWNYTDREGFYSLRYVPSGPFDLRAWQDRDRDGEAGPSEPAARGAPGLLSASPDTAYGVLSLIEPDTTPAQLVSASVEDSATLLFEFDDYLDPASPGQMIEGVLFPEGDDRILVFRLFHEHEHETWLAEQSDSVEAAADAGRPDAEGGQGAGSGPTQPAGLSGALLPTQTLTGVLDEGLERGRAYEAVLTGVFNLVGLETRDAKTVLLWEMPASDSTAVPPEGAETDTTVAPPDTTQAPPDTTQAPPDTTQAPPDTTQAPPDTTQAPPDTLRLPPDTLRTPADPPGR